MFSDQFIDTYNLESILLLAIRIALGVAFVWSFLKNYHDVSGYAKLNNMSVWLAKVLLTVKLILVVTLLLGVSIQVTALGVMAISLGAILIHTLKWKSPYLAIEAGWEYQTLLLLLSAVLFVYGTGDFYLTI